MSAPRTLFATTRPLFRQPFLGAAARQTRFTGVRSSGFSTATKARASGGSQQKGWQGSKRWSSTAAGEQQMGWFKRMWESPVGLKTVHFWAPIMKWAIVIAGISDFARPAEKLSTTQNFALTCTGLIWTRWCLIIKPKNYLLAAVNFFLGIVGIVQMSRIATYKMNKDKGGVTGIIADAKDEVTETVEVTKEKISLS